MEVEVNFLSVFLATVVSVIVGFIWYMPSVFGDAWIKMAKIDPKKGNMAWSFGAVLVSSFIMAFVLAYMSFISNYIFQNSFLQDTITTAFWIWFGFQGLRMFMHDQFSQRRKKETLIHAGNDLAIVMSMAAVIGLVGL